MLHPHLARLRRKGVNILRRIVCTVLAIRWRRYRRNGVVDIASVSSILLIRNDAIGDLVVTTPLIRNLRALHPGVRIGVAGSYRNLPLIASDPDVSHTYDLATSHPRTLIRELRRARRDGWDVVINTVFLHRTRGAIFSRLIAGPHGITATAVRTRAARYKNLYSVCEALPGGADAHPMIEQVSLLLPMVFGEHDSKVSLRASIYLPPEIETGMREQLSALPRGSGSRRFIHVNVEAANEWREWGIANSITFGKALLQLMPDASVLLTSSPFFAPEIVRAVKESAEERIQYVPTSSVLELTALVRCCDLVISPDTAVIHIASAERKPTVALFFRRGEWMPYRVPSKVLLPHPGNAVASIAVSDVLGAALALLVTQDTDNSAQGALLEERRVASV